LFLLGERQEGAIGQAELLQFPQAHQEELPPQLGDLMVGPADIGTGLAAPGWLGNVRLPGVNKKLDVDGDLAGDLNLSEHVRGCRPDL
jgi:hypothetical protein